LLVDVGAGDEFEDGALRIVVVDGRELGLLRWGEELFAVRNVCPHLGGPVCAGALAPHLHADTDGRSLELDLSRPVLACAWHRWEFDVRTGHLLLDPSIRLRTYPVRADAGGRVQVELP
jgi:3-phenylpropionate/trans-cinnamate dioxygenase ferredoxin subunit